MRSEAVFGIISRVIGVKVMLIDGVRVIRKVYTVQNLRLLSEDGPLDATRCAVIDKLDRIWYGEVVVELLTKGDGVVNLDAQKSASSGFKAVSKEKFIRAHRAQTPWDESGILVNWDGFIVTPNEARRLFDESEQEKQKAYKEKQAMSQSYCPRNGRADYRRFGKSPFSEPQ